MIIAIDGPAASGKGTLARHLARHFGLAYLDTGALYRALAVTIMNSGHDPADEQAALQAIPTLDPSRFADHELRAPGAGDGAAIIAVNAKVRQAMMDRQRQFANSAPGAVLDGRDIGTVVCPDADFKLYIDADIDVRAKRRFDELAARGEATSYEAVRANLIARDRRDRNRAVAPLKCASDAHLLDTSELDIETAFQAAVALFDSHYKR